MLILILKGSKTGFTRIPSDNVSLPSDFESKPKNIGLIRLYPNFSDLIRVLILVFVSEFMLHEELTNKIIAAFYNVYNVLGSGFLEKVYENALAIELIKIGLSVTQQGSVKVFYNGVQVGDYYADIIVNGLVILELKAAESLRNEHFAQLTNYLKATDKEVGLLLNFGKTPEFKRIVLGNETKTSLTQIP